MAIGDLLWACPECGRIGGIRADICSCGVRFRRGGGSTIEAILPDGSTLSRTPADWLAALPDPASLLDVGAGDQDDPVRTARVRARETVGSDTVRWRGRYLNRVERYGPERDAALELYADRLVYRPDGQERRTWALDHLSAIQASSSTLQVKPRGGPLVSFRFQDDSVFLWEMLLRAALRRHYRRTGQGDIIEFQPRITAR